jgi:hypothetical protein
MDPIPLTNEEEESLQKIEICVVNLELDKNVKDADIGAELSSFVNGINVTINGSDEVIHFFKGGEMEQRNQLLNKNIEILKKNQETLTTNLETVQKNAVKEEMRLSTALNKAINDREKAIDYGAKLLSREVGKMTKERDEAIFKAANAFVDGRRSMTNAASKASDRVESMTKERDAANDNAAKAIKKGLKTMTAERDQAIIDRDAANASRNQAIGDREIQLREAREEISTLTNRIAALDKHIRRSSNVSNDEPSAKKRKQGR